MLRGLIGLGPRVNQVVEENVLPIAVRVRGDETEAIEVRAHRLLFARERQARAPAIQSHGNASVSVGGGNVFQRPVVRRAIR